MMTDANTQASGQPAAARYDQELRPAEVAGQLDISTATLRRWSRRFEPYLGTSDGGRSHRRYSVQDVETLTEVKTLLEEGWTYDQVAQHLEDRRDGAVTVDGLVNATTPTADPSSFEEEEEPDADVAAVLGLSSSATTASTAVAEPLPPAVQVLRDSLQNISDMQQVLLNSQQANRDMLGVMIQDNLNLKGENTSLRDRMLDMERELAELRRRHADYRERMESRVRVLEDAVARLMADRSAPAQPVAPPPQAYGQPPAQVPGQPPPEKRGFWSRLIGG